MLKRDVIGLIGLWLIVTACNLFKPYTIDDTAYLIISNWILHHPLHPMSGPLNWEGTVQPIYATNQPHLYFYSMAIWERFFGFSEVALHSLQSLFSAGCIILFYQLARRLSEAHRLWLTAMLALNPALVVSQNLMVDIPLLACWLGFFACLICGIATPRQNQRFLMAALACSAAILIKYSSLVLIPVLLVTLVLERRPRQAWALAIPVVILSAWSAFNLYDYGGIHLLTALHASATTYNVNAPHLSLLQHLGGALRKLMRFAKSWDIGVGALSWFGIIALAQVFPRAANAIYAFCLAGLIALLLSVGVDLLPDRRADHILQVGFALSGILALLPVLRPQRNLTLIYLQTWIVLTSIFYVFASPFIAARHVLLILPAIALLVAATRPISRGAKAFGLLITVIISCGLCLSDFRFAELYKTEAATVTASVPAGAKIWAAGHWGWQYYAAKNGIPEIDIGEGLAQAMMRCKMITGLDPSAIPFLEKDPSTRLPKACSDLGSPFPNASVILPGDYLIVPLQVDHELPTNITLRPVRATQFNLSADDPFCTGRPVRFYDYAGAQGPWSLSTNCTQEIDIFQVAK